MNNKKYILVAEDDKNYSKIFFTKLTREGYKVKVAGDGAEALREIAKKTPDIILLDIMMPIKNGFEVLEEIRADKKLDNIKVIMVSNLGQDSDMEKATALGANGYFTKADSPLFELMEKIKKSLK